MFLKKIIFCGLIIFVFAMILNSGLIAQARQIDRIITVTVVADEEYIDFYGENEWKDRIKRIIERASWAFEEQFGIGFKIERFKKWNSEDYSHPKLSDKYSSSSYTACSELNKGYLIMPMPFVRRRFNLRPCFELEDEIKPKKSDIVIAFTGQPDLEIPARVDNILGRYVLMVDLPSVLPWFTKRHGEALEILRTQIDLKKKEENLRFLKLWFNIYKKFIPERIVDERYEIVHVLIHELGHLFGAVHTEEDSVMKVPSSTNRFDPENAKIVFKYKWRKFK